MPTIYEPQSLPVTEKYGATIATLSNRAMLGADALRVEHIILKASAKSLMFESVEPERFVYVIHGKGKAFVGVQSFLLDVESVLWLEKGDVFSLEAGADGLEVLFCRAPASE